MRWLALSMVLAWSSPVWAGDAEDLAEAARLDTQIDAHYASGNLDAALDAAERALALRRKVLAAGTPGIGESLAQLGAIHHARAEHEAAERALDEAIALLERGGPPLRLAAALGSLGAVRIAQGHAAEGRALIERAIAIAEKEAPDGTELATYLGNLAQIERAGRRYAPAEELYRRALALHEKNGNASGRVSMMLGLAELEQGRGRGYQAFEWWNRALELSEQALADQPLVRARVASSVAGALRQNREWERAYEKHERALDLYRRHLGERHPQVARELFAYSYTRWAAFDRPRAVELRREAHAIEEEHLEHLIAHGEERALFAHLGTLLDSFNDTVSLHLVGAPGDPSAARLALELVLRRKGRVLDAMSQRRARLSGLVAADAPSQPITIEAVRRAIPDDAALIEIVRYHPRSERPWSDASHHPPRYAGYVLQKSGPIRHALMNDADSIETLAREVRAQLADPRRKLESQLWGLNAMSLQRPLIGLDHVKHLLVSPDGALAQIPFGALADHEGHALLRRYTFTYLASGRDLMRLAASRPEPRSGPLVIAAPDFGEGAADGARAAGGLRFTPLPGAAEEARAIAPLLKEATVLVGAAAREDALRKARGPRLLHLATHGFLLPDARTDARGPRAELALAREQDPLLRTGLAFAGANHPPAEGSDGVVTALELASVDLQGTKLVVLSACDTGLGELRRGEGIYGLRRAVALAGAETLVMSLWQVDDRATRALMQRYYEELLAGAGRSEALRRAQLELFEDERTRHPYYWAPFIVSGDWRPLERPAEPTLAKPVTPPAEAPRSGCACAARPAGRAPVAALLAIALAITRRWARARSGRRAVAIPAAR